MNGNDAVCHVLPEVMALDVDVLGLGPHLQKLCQFECTRVVLEHLTMYFALLPVAKRQACLCRCTSHIRFFKGMASLSAVDKAMYSASVVERAISVYSLDPQVKGQSAKQAAR